MKQSFRRLLLCVLFLAQNASGQAAIRDPRTSLRDTARALDWKKDALTPDEKRRLLNQAIDLLQTIDPVTAINEDGACELPSHVEYDVDTRIRCAAIRIKDGTELVVKNGSLLYLDAKQIVIGSSVRILGKGAKGAKGATGRSIEGPWQSQGDNDYFAALGDCRSNSGHPDRGGVGYQGQQGGRGALIVLKVNPSRSFAGLDLQGGDGGDGGDGGSGRLYRNGRNYYCDGCTANCPSNGSGPAGPKGTNGSILYLGF